LPKLLTNVEWLTPLRHGVLSGYTLKSFESFWSLINVNRYTHFYITLHYITQQFIYSGLSKENFKQPQWHNKQCPGMIAETGMPSVYDETLAATGQV